MRRNFRAARRILPLMHRLGVVVAILTGLLLAGALPQAAQAAPYVLYSCKAPDGSPAPTDGWSASPVTTGDGMVFRNRCASGGSLRGVVDETKNHKRGDAIGFSFLAPPDTRLTAYDLSRRVALDPARRNPDNSIAQAYDYSLFRGEPRNFTPEGQREACYSSGAANNTQSSGKVCTLQDGVFSEAGAKVDDLYLFADCSYLYQDCTAGFGGSIELRAARLTLEDGIRPAFVGTPTGSLLDADGPQSGVRDVSFGASDRGGGVGRAVLEIDGQPVAERRFGDVPGGCREPYVLRVPCPVSVRDGFSVDTATLADGRHEVRLVVTDATRVNQVVYGPISIETSNPEPAPVPAPAPAPAPAPQPTSSRDPGAAPLWTVRLRTAWTFGRRTRVRTLTVSGLERDARVSLRCKGRGCAFRSRTVRTGGRSLVRLAERFKRRSLRKGTEITLRISRPGRGARTFLFRMRSKRLPHIRQSCRAPNGKAVACGRR